MQSSDLAKRMSFAGMAPSGPVADAVRRWFGGWRGWVILGIVLVVAGLAAGWSWLTAIGVAPLILSVAPCAAMCALGLCAMSRGGGASCSKSGSAPPQTGSSTPADGHGDNV